MQNFSRKSSLIVTHVRFFLVPLKSHRSRLHVNHFIEEKSNNRIHITDINPFGCEFFQLNNKSNFYFNNFNRKNPNRFTKFQKLSHHLKSNKCTYFVY